MKSIIIYRFSPFILLILSISICKGEPYTKHYTETIDITGKVVDEDNLPVFVTITEKGTKNGTTTDSSGNFLLKGVDNNAVLLISGVNVDDLEIHVNGKTDLGIIKVKIFTGLLDEVVVANTGYQTINANEINGSVTVIDNNTLNKQTGTNILDRLNGVTSGFAFTNKNHTGTQSDLNIAIRGLSTINGPLNPLIVLDNFIYEGDIRNINPNDIESVTVLKDASSTSIYGARGGNGVIVLTSKKGSRHQPLRVDMNSTFIISEKPDLFKASQISSADYIAVEQFLYRNGYYKNLIDNDWFYHTPFTPAVEIFIKKQNGLITSEDSLTQIEELKRVDSRREFMKYFYTNAATQQYSIHMRGGGSRNSYSLGLSYDRNLETNFGKFNKLNFIAQNDFYPVKGLKIGIGVYYTKGKSESGRPLSVDMNGKKVPYLKLADSNGTPLALPKAYSQSFTDTVGGGKLFDWNYYPLNDYKHDKTISELDQIVANVNTNYQIMNGLNLQLLYQYQSQTQLTERIADLESFYMRNLINKFTQIDNSNGLVKYIVPPYGSKSIYNTSSGSQNLRMQVNLNKSSGSHAITAISGSEIREIEVNSNSSRIYGFNEDPLMYSSVDFANSYQTIVNGSYEKIEGSPQVSVNTNRFVSFFANVVYAYKGVYSLSASFRKDGSNIFGVQSNNKWNPLWSAGLGWNISKEGFYNSGLISYLKLRTTLGYSGNVDLTKTALPVARNLTDPYTNFPATRIRDINNPDLKWETIQQINLGVEFSIANDNVSGSVDYYIKRGSDLYGPTPYDYTTWGATAEITKNVANMKGKGVDLIIKSDNLKKPVKWETTFLFNFNTAITTKYFTQEAVKGRGLIGAGNYIVPVIGKPLYAIAAYKWGGLDSDGNPQGILNGQKTTDYPRIFQDISERGVDNSASVIYIGPANPVYFGSLINSFKWRQISIDFNISYKLGYYFYKPALSYGALYQSGAAINDFEKRWQKPGDELITNVPAMVYTNYPNFCYRESIYLASEKNVLKADHIRLQYVNVNFELPLKKLNSVKHITLYFNAANLGLVWTQNKEKIDPDFPSGITSAKYTFGLKTSF